jgi:hypothetical protein
MQVLESHQKEELRQDVDRAILYFLKWKSKLFLVKTCCIEAKSQSRRWGLSGWSLNGGGGASGLRIELLSMFKSSSCAR